MWKRPKPGYNTPQMKQQCREMNRERMKEMAKRGRKPGQTNKKKESNRALGLIEALNFIALAQSKAGTTPQCYSAMSGNWLVASNGTGLMMGTKVADDMVVCPHTLQFLDALSKCGEDLSISQLNQNTLSVNSGDFRAIIPCANYDELILTFTAPDPETNPIGNEIRKAFEIFFPILNENAEFGYLAGVCLRQNTVVATNGSLLMEYWHGMNLPGDFLIPKPAAKALAKCGKNLKGFGCSPNSVTFYFDDGSFIKSQLFQEKFPPYEHFFTSNINPWPLPNMFFDAIKMIESFTNDGIIHFIDGFIASATNQNVASTFKIAGLPNGLAFNSKYLLLCQEGMKNVFFDTENHKIFFFGGMIRGILLGISFGNKQVELEEAHEVKPPIDVPKRCLMCGFDITGEMEFCPQCHSKIDPNDIPF